MATGRYANKLFRSKKLPKTAKQMERHLKGVANHWRIEIILLLGKNQEMNVDDLAQEVNANYSTLSTHIFRLVHAGLVDKKYKGRNVMHTLTPYGQKFLSFLHTFQHS